MDKDTPRIFTGRYADPAIARSGLVPVGVTRYRPRFPLSYTLAANLLDLAPSAAMLAQAKRGTLTPRQFEKRYVAQLEEVGAERILTTLRGLQGDAPGVVLLCYEDVTQGQTCHRRMFATWFQKKEGIMIPEFTTTAAQPIAIGYIRRSHESTERTVSLVAQRAAIERYAAEQGWHLAAVLEHDGISGGKRSRFAALDAAVKENGARYVVAYHLDRVARDVAGLMDWVAAAAKRGIELHIVGRGKTETVTAAGYLTTGVEGIMAAYFRLVVAEKTRDALGHLRTQGKRWTRTPPYGWRWTQDGRVELDPVEQAVIAKARTLRVGGATLWSISATLAASGTLSRVGRPLSAKVVRSILRRPS